jgi:hypothetical protein
VSRAFPDRDVEAAHAALLQAALAGEVERAVAILTDHHARTAAVILQDMAAAEKLPPAARRSPPGRGLRRPGTEAAAMPRRWKGVGTERQ